MITTKNNQNKKNFHKKVNEAKMSVQICVQPRDGVGLRIIKMRSYEPRQQNNKSERKPFQNDDRREYAGSPWAASWRLSFDLREHFQTRLKMLS